MLLCRRIRKLKEGDPSMEASTSSLGDADAQRRARRGLAIYLGVVIALSALFDVLIIAYSPSWISALMFAPAAASVVARLVFREGFADVSFRFGGRRTWKMILLALAFPIIVGLLAYGVAWASGLARFDRQSEAGPFAGFTGEITSSPAMVFVITLILTTFVLVFPSAFFAAGEEIGWRGYMLTRLIDAGVPRPILVSGLIWGLWHIPIILGGMYVAGTNPYVSAVIFMVSVTSWAL
jgi:uncharacterized protein